MPNRILKESICSSEEIDQLSLFQEVFFYRLIVNCDDFGRMDARPKILCAKLFPLREVKQKNILESLHALASSGLILLYEDGDHPYLQMKTWDRHQSIRAKKSKYPSPDECKQMNADDFICKQMISDESKCPRNPIQSNPNPYPNPNTNPNPIREYPAKPEDLFPRFWSAYPRKDDKANAKKQFDKIKPDEELLQKMLSTLEKQKKSEQWQSDGGKFIPYAATWLNGQRWEDEVPEKKTIPAPAPTKTVVAQQYTQRPYDDEQQDAMERMIAEYRQEVGS